MTPDSWAARQFGPTAFARAHPSLLRGVTAPVKGPSRCRSRFAPRPITRRSILGSRALRQDARDDVAVDVGQTEVAAAVVEGQPLMVEAEQMQYRGVPVVNMHRVLDRLVAELVGRPIGQPAPDAAAGHPDGEPFAVVV